MSLFDDPQVNPTELLLAITTDHVLAPIITECQIAVAKMDLDYQKFHCPIVSGD